MKKTSCITLSLLSLLITQSCLAASDIIISEISQDAHYNGIDTVTISPAKNGISHIYYNKFNVSPEGIKLNNQYAQADLIINEVVLEQKSQLNGNIRVTDKKANLIIANPQGIDCINCSFSGVNEVKLISGSSNQKYGNIFYIAENNSINFSFDNIEKNNHLEFSLGKDISSGKKIHIISNDVNILRGYLNSKQLTFEIGMNKINLDAKFKDYGADYFMKRLNIEKEAGVNSHELVVRSNYADVYNNGQITATILSVQGGYFINNGSLSINQGDKVYDKDFKKRSWAYIDVYRYINTENSSLNLNKTDTIIKTPITAYPFRVKLAHGDTSTKDIDLQLKGEVNLTHARLNTKGRAVLTNTINVDKSTVSVNAKLMKN